MPRAMLFAGMIILGFGACKHPEEGDGDSVTLSASGDGSGASRPGSDGDPDIPDVPVKQAWSEGGKSLTVHRSADCPSASVEDSGCGNETSYRFSRNSRELALTTCRCGSEHVMEKKLKLTPGQRQDLDKLMDSLDIVTSPQVACPPGTAAINWELIVENAQAVEQSYPVALCGSPRQTARIDSKSFQALYEYLKTILPE